MLKMLEIKQNWKSAIWMEQNDFEAMNCMHCVVIVIIVAYKNARLLFKLNFLSTSHKTQTWLWRSLYANEKRTQAMIDPPSL